ncbi:RBBP9/YdeN family alpha/beta hydrolase [Gordonia sp. CPCC 205333]|uniref:RBBP9/YdeN family alpha/beta hydrolase n=1 Tax=Gordonia sp. CPCC 205333 TaxID=3140790 RepID=UPI003AF3FB1C
MTGARRIRRAIIVHGYLGNSGKHWFGSLTSELTQAGIAARAVDLPDPTQPRLDDWIEHLDGQIGQPDPELLLIAHSLGCVTTTAYLRQLTSPFALGGLVTVAPFYEKLPTLPELDGFISAIDEPPDGLREISSKILQRIVIRSDDDPYVPVAHSNRYAQCLDAAVIVDPNAEHFFEAAYPSISTATRTVLRTSPIARSD